MKMISGGRNVHAPLTCETRRGEMIAVVQISFATSKLTSVAELANRWLDRGVKCPRGCMEIRFLVVVQQTETVIEINCSICRPREFVTSCPHRGLCPLKSPSKINGAGN
ncbi:hypothetical protein TNCV_99771 [Trichonephila clavipes]|nr:hypothetical protein TNCV_99771 [Trichonephila clavipes]